MTQVILSLQKCIKETGSTLVSLQKIHGPNHKTQEIQDRSMKKMGRKQKCKSFLTVHKDAHIFS